MPQDIPWEATDTLPFTPATLSDLEKPPVFTLRTPTSREKRFRLRLLREAMVTTHSQEALRAETLTGLKALWGEDKFKEFSGHVTGYWDYADDFRLQVKADPDTKWSFDDDEQKAVEDLLRQVARNWAPLGRMNADNAEYQDMLPAATIAVMVKSWTGIDVEQKIDRGYLTLDCVDAIDEKLRDQALETGIDGSGSRLPLIELYAACERRFNLEEEEAKNSESPSLSSEAPPPSTTGGKAKATKSKSRTSTPSPKTPSST